MCRTSKAELIECLRSQLQRAKESQRRWEQLGSVMRTTNAQSWNTIAILRREEVEQFQVLLEWAEDYLPTGDLDVATGRLNIRRAPHAHSG